MNFNYDETKGVLTVTTDEGKIEKYIFQKPVGKLFEMILEQMENTSGSSANIADWAKADNTDKIPEEKIPDMFDNVDVVSELPETGVQDRIYIVTGGDNAGKRYYWNGTEFVEMPDEGGITIGTVTGTAYDGGKGTELEATVADKLGVNDVSAWAKAQDPSTIPLEKMDENVVKYSDFSYTPSGEETPVERKTIQLANYDSISGMNIAGNDAANLIMMSKWDKVDIGSSRYPVNLNGSEFTLNDNRDIAKVYETNDLTNLSEGAADDAIRSALGLDFENLIEIIRDKNVIIVDRNSAGDYKTCIHATGNISSGNGGANLMFMIGTKPIIYQIQYVSGTFALAVIKYEFATTQDVSDSISAEASARDKAIKTATSDLVHNTLTVAGKSLTGNITLASTDLTNGEELVKKGEILNTVIDGDTNETLRQALTARTHLPFARSTPLENQTEAQVFALFDGSVTDKASLKTYLISNMAYIAYNLDSLGEHQYYKLPIVLASIPDSGDITVIAMGPDIYNSDLMTKFTYTIVLNGDASSVTINKKVLES